MHFWIDKRSQCAYTGRHRVPSSISAGVGRSRGRVGARKGMAAPVHRFAALDPPPRRPPRAVRNHPQAAIPSVHGRRPPEEPSLYVEMPAPPPQPTIASLAAARSVTPDTLLRTAALGLHHSPMMAPHLKFGMLVSFALATVFLAGAKYYFDRQLVRDSSRANNNEAGVVCFALASLALVGCCMSLCARSKPEPPPLPPDRVSSTAQRHLPPSMPRSPPPATLALPPLAPASPPARRAASLAALAAAEAPPPPYHIAVLLPQRRELSPPAYSALS